MDCNRTVTIMAVAKGEKELAVDATFFEALGVQSIISKHSIYSDSQAAVRST